MSASGKGLKKLAKHARLITQLAFTALTNGYVNGFLKGKIYSGPLKKFCVPGLNCYSCPGALLSCPIGSLQAVAGSRSFHFSLYVFGIIAAFGALMGRFVCGWLCPFGLFQDLLYKIPPKKLKLRRLPGEKLLRLLRYAVLGIFVILLPALISDISGRGTPWCCKYVCPAGLLMGGIPLALVSAAVRNAIGGLFWWKFGILALIALLSVFLYRPFCRYLCPLGALYGCFNPISLYRYRIDKNVCTECGACQRECGLDIDVFRNPNSPDCIRCGKCIRICPQNAIKNSFSKSGNSGIIIEKVDKPEIYKDNKSGGSS